MADDKMKKILEDQILNEVREKIIKENQDYRNMLRALKEDNTHRSSHELDEKGNAIDHWAEVDALVARSEREQRTSIHDWKSSMLEVLSLMIAIGKGLQQSRRQMYLGSAVELALFETWFHLFRAQNTPDTWVKLAEKGQVLPSLAHHISVSPEGKLHIDPLLRSDNISAPKLPYDEQDTNPEHQKANAAATYAQNKFQQFDRLFAAGIEDWLKENDYTKNNDGVFMHTDGVTPLTQNKFDELKTGPISLSTFLEIEHDLEFTERKTPSL